MNDIVEDDEIDRILAGADFVESEEAEGEPRPTPELIGAVQSPTIDAASTEGMAPREGSAGELRTGEGLCQGPSLCISQF